MENYSPEAFQKASNLLAKRRTFGALSPAETIALARYEYLIGQFANARKLAHEAIDLFKNPIVITEAYAILQEIKEGEPKFVPGLDTVFLP